MSTSITTQPSTSFKSTNHFYTIWYPSIETTTLSYKNDVNFFSSSSSSSSSSSTSSSSSSSISSSTDTSNNISKSNVESTPFITDISTMYPVTSKEISQTETVSLEPRTFSNVSNEIHSMSSTLKIETEYSTHKLIYNETNTTEIIYQENDGRTLKSINDTSSSEEGSTMEYTSSTR